MEYAQQEKLNQFEQAILQKAQSQRDAILAETEQQKKSELDQEESLLLEGLYQGLQSRINEIKTENQREVARESLSLKKQLYAQREQYLSELVARARVELSAFTRREEYASYMRRKAEGIAKRAGRLDGAVIRLRTEDLCFVGMLEEVLPGCKVEADSESRIAIGGMILEDRKRGVEIDESLDTALMQQKEWFYNHSNFHFD